MSTEKLSELSELSNPAWIVGQQEIADFMRGDEALLVRGYDPESTEPALRMYSQEYANALLAENMRVAHDLIARNGEIEGLKKRTDELLAELEAKDERIAELDYIRASLSQVLVEFGDELGCNPDNESIMMAIDELKKRLATPVRLPDVLFVKVSGHAVPVMHADRVNERVRAAGFKIEGDVE